MVADAGTLARRVNDELAARLTAIAGSSAGRALIRSRWPVLLLLAAARIATSWRVQPTDSLLFEHSGQVLLSSHWADAFVDRRVQVGPLMLLFYGCIGDLTGLPTAAAYRASSPNAPTLLTESAVIQVGLLVLFVLLVRHTSQALHGRRPTGGRELAAGLALLALDIPGLCVEYGHPSEVVLLVLWVRALLAAQDGRPGRATGWVVLAAGIVTQGALGAMALLLSRPARRAVLAFVAVPVLSAAWYVPFTLRGTVNTNEMVWPVRPRSALAPLLGTGYPFTWADRVVQSGVIAVVTAVFVLALWRSPLTAWLVPAAMLVTRIGTDPYASDQYLMGVQAAGLLGACLTTRSELHAAGPALIASYPLLFLNTWPVWEPAGIGMAGLVVSTVRARGERAASAATEPRLARKPTGGASSPPLP